MWCARFGTPEYGGKVAKVRIVADYCGKGYQLLENGETAGTFLIGAPLQERLCRWNERYEAHCDPLHYEDVSGAGFDFVAFAAEGLAIARAVKRRLPQWTVTYWDEALDWYLSRDPRTYDPTRAEYEITLRDAFTDTTLRSQGGAGGLPR